MSAPTGIMSPVVLQDTTPSGFVAAYRRDAICSSVSVLIISPPQEGNDPPLPMVALFQQQPLHLNLDPAIDFQSIYIFWWFALQPLRGVWAVVFEHPNSAVSNNCGHIVCQSWSVRC